MDKLKLFKPFSLEKEEMYHLKGGATWNTTYEIFNIQGDLLESGDDTANDFSSTNNTTDDQSRQSTDSKPPAMQ